MDNKKGLFLHKRKQLGFASIEYMLCLALLAMSCFTVISTVSTGVKKQFLVVQNALVGAEPGR